MRIGIEILILLIVFVLLDIAILICSFRVNKKDKANKKALEMAIKALDGHTEEDGTAKQTEVEDEVSD